jgi:hypothetical protein
MHTYVYDAMRKKYYIFETREQNKMIDNLHETEKQHDEAKIEIHTLIQKMRQEKIKNKDLSERI